LLLHCISNCNPAVVHVNVEALVVSFTLQLGPLLSLLQLRCERTLKEKIYFLLKTSYKLLVLFLDSDHTALIIFMYLYWLALK